MTYVCYTHAPPFSTPLPLLLPLPLHTHTHTATNNNKNTEARAHSDAGRSSHVAKSKSKGEGGRGAMCGEGVEEGEREGVYGRGIGRKGGEGEDGEDTEQHKRWCHVTQSKAALKPQAVFLIPFYEPACVCVGHARSAALCCLPLLLLLAGFVFDSLREGEQRALESALEVQEKCHQSRRRQAPSVLHYPLHSNPRAPHLRSVGKCVFLIPVSATVSSLYHHFKSSLFPLSNGSRVHAHTSCISLMRDSLIAASPRYSGASVLKRWKRTVGSCSSKHVLVR